ncbi:hypothetical protein LCGC14_2739920 [marine sediment metagenome]|uniref:Uncharacterized protein n=1 Tax=marine sediment metagenome TaxID=412755 RepID=A0A0F8ZRW6_9ZZZZ
MTPIMKGPLRFLFWLPILLLLWVFAPGLIFLGLALVPTYVLFLLYERHQTAVLYERPEANLYRLQYFLGIAAYLVLAFFAVKHGVPLISVGGPMNPQADLP